MTNLASRLFECPQSLINIRRPWVRGLATLAMWLVPLTVGAESFNFAAALRWHGYGVTDLKFTEFFNQDHTVMARFMLQYPAAYEGPILAVNEATGYTYSIGQGNSVSRCPGCFQPEEPLAEPKLVVKIGAYRATYTLPSVPVAGRWQHLAIVRSGGSTFQTYTLYLNGVRRGRDGCYGCDLVVYGGYSIPQGPVRAQPTLQLGTSNRDALTSKSQFYGLIDDVAVFNKALSASEIQSHAGAFRLTGTEANLVAGYTFDSLTPSGQALPAALSRPVNLVQPAFTTVVSQARVNSVDTLFLPAPAQQTAMQLPFEIGEVWKVLWGWESNSHIGDHAFCWDFTYATLDGGGIPVDAPNLEGKGRTLYASAGGKVTSYYDGGDTTPSDAVNEMDASNYLRIEQAPGEDAVYMHVLTGSVPQWIKGMLFDPAYVQTGELVGGVGTRGPTNYHVHFDGTSPKVTIPVAFSNYEVWDSADHMWKFVKRGVPLHGQYVRRSF